MRPKEKILLVSRHLPESENRSWWGRLRYLTGVLARRYEVFFAPGEIIPGHKFNDRVLGALKKSGVNVVEQHLSKVLTKHQFKLAIVLSAHAAERYLAMIRELQPDLDVILDLPGWEPAQEVRGNGAPGKAGPRSDEHISNARMLEVCQSVEAIITDNAGCKETLLLSDENLLIKVIPRVDESIRDSELESSNEPFLRFLDQCSQTLRPKRLARLERCQYEVGADIFQRYRMAADVIEFIREGRMKILDVGARGDLLKFLPSDFVVTVDPNPQFITRTFLAGDGLMLPFADSTFDLALGIDVVEHLSATDREKFLDELARVSSRGLIVASPFRSAMNEECETIVNELHKVFYTRENPWLSEHIMNKLPELDDVVMCLRNKGFSVSVLPNGYLPRWVFLMSLYYFLASVDGADALIRTLNAFYNRNYYLLDNREPCYRYVIVALRDGSPPHLEQLYGTGEQKRESAREELPLALSAFPFMEVLRFLHEKDTILREFQAQMRERELRYRRVFNRWPFRIYRMVKSVFSRVVPHRGDN